MMEANPPALVVTGLTGNSGCLVARREQCPARREDQVWRRIELKLIYTSQVHEDSLD